MASIRWEGFGNKWGLPTKIFLNKSSNTHDFLLETKDLNKDYSRFLD